MHLTLYHSDLITFRFTCTRKTVACALLQSKLDKKCIRVFRSSTLSNSKWKPMPGEGSTNYRYDGMYMIVECMGVTNQCDQFAHNMIPSGDNSSFTFCLTRCDTQSAHCNGAFMNIIKRALFVSNQSDLHLAHKQQEKNGSTMVGYLLVDCSKTYPSRLTTYKRSLRSLALRAALGISKLYFLISCHTQ